jgi:dTDP-glucose 4,6-dehydratase
MDTILVTGGAGFIGSNFVRAALARTPSRVVVLDKLTYAGSLLNLEEVAKDPRYSFVRGDVADRALVRRVLQEHRPQWVVHFAAESHVDRSIDDPSPVVTTNLVGTFELLEASRRLVAGLDPAARARFRFLQVSTDEVYGSLGETGLFHETTAYDPSSPYSATKAGADHLAQAWARTYGLPVLITNCSNNYGPRQYPEKLVPLVILNALEGKDLPIYGDGGNVRDWLFVGDHCEAILDVLERGRPGQTYNVGGDSERTNLQVVDRICDALDEAVPAAGNAALAARGKRSYRELKTFVADRPGHDRRYAIDAGKIKAELGWRPRHAFEDGLAETVRWYVANRAWCEGVQAGKYRRERLGLAAHEGDRA